MPTNEDNTLRGRLIEAVVVADDRLRLKVQKDDGDCVEHFVDLAHGNEILACCNGIGSRVVVTQTLDFDLDTTGRSD